MKVLFMADTHIKLKQKNVPKEWLLNRYSLLWNKIKKLSKEVDLTVLGGDIFDKMPTLEELGIYVDMISNISGKTIIFSGNHEATKRGATFFTALKDITEKYTSEVEILLEPCERYGIDFIPYTHIKVFNPKDFNNDILCTHVRGQIPPHVRPEINLDRFQRWKTVLAGDLHSYKNSQSNILYPGSPFGINFTRSINTYGVIIFDTCTKTHEFKDMALPQLLRQTVKEEKDIVKTEFHHTIYDIEGTEVALSSIKDNELLDKKISIKKQDSVLNFSNVHSIPEELEIYFQKVLKLSDTEIIELIGVFNDYTTTNDME